MHTAEDAALRETLVRTMRRRRFPGAGRGDAHAHPLAPERGGTIETEETERAKAVLPLRVSLRWCTDGEHVRGWRQELDGARRGVAVAVAEAAGDAGGKGGKGACQLCPRRATSRVKPGFSSSLLSRRTRHVHESVSWRRVRKRRILGNTDFRYPPSFASRRRRDDRDSSPVQ